MNSIFKKNFLILLVFLIVFSSSSYIVFADDETFDNGAVNKSQTYDYASGLSKLFIWHDDVSGVYVDRRSYWLGSKSFDFNFSGDDQPKNILGLRLVGGFLIDGGVNKYAVQIIDGETIKEHDVYNSASEGNLSDEFDLSPTEDYSNFEKNCMFDVDIYLEKYCGKKVSVNLIAYTNNSQVYTVVRLTNLEIASEDGDFVLQSGNILRCRYCIKETEIDIVRFEEYNYRSCINEYICSECKRSNIFLTPHDFNEAGKCFCGAVGTHICDWSMNYFYYLYDESDCQNIHYSCFGCEDTYDVTTQHNFENCVCTECFYTKDHEIEYVGSSDYLHKKDICFIKNYQCAECKSLISNPVSHTFMNNICSACGFVSNSNIGEDESSFDNSVLSESESEEGGSVVENKTLSDINFSSGIAIFLIINIVVLGYLFVRWILKKI